MVARNYCGNSFGCTSMEIVGLVVKGVPFGHTHRMHWVATLQRHALGDSFDG